ncbi:hypothetical protein N657DRAFT_42890 [Parathielavia appendiculata]|uniref:DUF7791 domain-containing protein n=1 Tax=Parathielavia appendiculata TaxID=2587402 RepID=A0AAN6U9C9_9PEZI|nr:hypothetical protein N657DRAFT_42890 [Parathielavia appendiculata]
MLPCDLGNLYKQAWRIHGDDEALYRAEAARYFRLVMTVNGFEKLSAVTLFDLYVVNDQDIQNTFFEGNRVLPARELLRKLAEYRRRIEVCCGGLLEVRENNEDAYKWLDDPEEIDKVFYQFLMPLCAFISAGVDAPSGGELAALCDACSGTQVDFVHRTAADVLVETQWGRGIIDSDTASQTTISAKLIRSMTMLFFLFDYPHNSFLQRRVMSAINSLD